MLAMKQRSYLISSLLCFFLSARTSVVQCSRSWRDINTVHSTLSLDVSARFYRHLEELAYKSQLESEDAIIDEPLPRASRMPSTNRPSPAPSSSPTSSPTNSPSKHPTYHPTNHPTVVPTQHPTEDPYREHDPPEFPKLGYFNYEQGPGANFGPGDLKLKRDGAFFRLEEENNNWGQVFIDPVNNYWKEFTEQGFGPWLDVLDIHQPLRNKCSTGTMQSPIDVKENGGVCFEHHEVRSLPGDFGVRGDHVQKRIESNKLRLIYERRPCADLEKKECQEPDPPHADFPQGWRGFADVTHVDFKVPSEHTIHGERFDAEMQIYHIHVPRRRVAAQSVLIRARKNGYNYYLQEALNAFQRVFNENYGLCRRRLRNTNTTEAPFGDYQSWAKFYTFGSFQEPWKRGYFQGGPWDPHHIQLIPTIHFYRYDGSLTEPPCGEFVTWWVADAPMIIGLEQLEQMKQLLFLNVDENCERTSVHHKRSVARPIQQTNNRAVWKCSSSDFGPD